MNALLRRRAMMATSKPQFEPFPVSPWTLNSGISSAGLEFINNPIMKQSALCLTYFPVSPEWRFKRTTPIYDAQGTHINVVVWEYSAANKNAFLRRAFLEADNEMIVSDDCEFVRFTIAYASSTGKSMTQAIIDQYFGVAIKKR